MPVARQHQRQPESNGNQSLCHGTSSLDRTLPLSSTALHHTKDSWLAEKPEWNRQGYARNPQQLLPKLARKLFAKLGAKLTRKLIQELI